MAVTSPSSCQLTNPRNPLSHHLNPLPKFITFTCTQASLSLSLFFVLLMALEIQRTLLRNFIQLMRDEGIVNDEFYQLQAMKETVRQDYVVRAVTSYCLSAQNLFSQLTYHISQPEIDYHLVHAAAHELYARTSSIGAEHVKISCAELIQACEQNDKEYCSRALYWTKNEYSKLRRKFETLVQMERKIIDLENGH